MNEMLDVETIYRQERQRWLREEAPQECPRCDRGHGPVLDRCGVKAL